MFKNLPDFVSKKVDMLTAAKQFKSAIDKNCKRMGMEPDYETNIVLDAPNKSAEQSKVITVMFEAGPFDWGVNYSLGSNPKSYSMHNNIQDWYLETYYGFDVMFTPVNYNAAPIYEQSVLEAA